MPTHRIPNIVWQWSLAENLETWSHDIKLILSEANPLDHEHLYNETDLTMVEEKLMKQARNKWHIEALGKSKLETFVQIHNFDEQKVLLKANLDHYHRSLIAQFKSGILPLRLETSRYKGIDREERYCQICDRNIVEDEIHFLFKCKKLKTTRKQHVKPILKEHFNIKKDSKIDMMKLLVSATHIKSFGQALKRMVLARRDILYK